MGLLVLLAPIVVHGHGGVVAEDDLCIIQIGVYTAHFTIYQPETRASEEFCEDLPGIGESLFVLDYLHPNLRDVPVELRIIRDVLGRTIYAAPEDLARIDDLEAATVFYQPPVQRRDGSFQVTHRFAEQGWYIGIVTAPHPSLDRSYTAVFGFHVGTRGWGFWPWVLLGLLAVQFQYWVSSGGFRRWRSAQRGNQ